MKQKLGLIALGAMAVLVIGTVAMAVVDWEVPFKSGMTVGDLLYASSGSKLKKITAVAAGKCLMSKGTSTAPAYELCGTGGASTLTRAVVSAASGTTALTVAQSGGVAVNTGTSSTTTFTLPAAAAGLNYCFVEGGDAAGELLVGVTGTNTVVGKTHGADDGTGIATASSTGIKNTAATNVKGDFACLTALNTSTWLMTSVAGVWASR